MAPRLKDLPKGAAAAVVALALVGSVVIGAPWPEQQPTAAEPASRATQPASQETAAIDLDKLSRQRKEGTVPDLFASQSAAAANAASTVATPQMQVAAPPPPPPSLPFRYLGRMTDAGRTVIFLESTQGLHSAAAGDVLEGVFRVESISETTITFRHVPRDVVLSLSASQTQ